MKKFILVTLILVASASLVIADDFELDFLPDADLAHYDLKKSCDGGTYYDFTYSTLSPKMQELSALGITKSNEDALSEGGSIGVRLDKNNTNFHVNFPNSTQGGRSYGWTNGKVGDWSDKLYLNSIEQVMASGDKKDIKNFYSTVIQLLGKCNPSTLSDLEFETQRVANNFLAIYTAEQYREYIKQQEGGRPMRWDDALLQTTLLASFHAGQSTFTKYYKRKFRDSAPDQTKCAYFNMYKTSSSRPARMNDYWQFGRTAEKNEKGSCSGRSGINLTRKDFERMGAKITQYQKVADSSSSLATIESIVGPSNNVIKAITSYYAEGRATPDQTDELAEAVSEFMIEIYDEADDITEWISNPKN